MPIRGKGATYNWRIDMTVFEFLVIFGIFLIVGLLIGSKL